MKYIVLIFLLIAVPVKADWATYGVGQHTCTEFNHYYEEGQTSEYVAFTAGYMTVLNRIQVKRDVLDMPPDRLVLFVHNVCQTPRRKDQIFTTVLNLTVDSIVKNRAPELSALYQ